LRGSMLEALADLAGVVGGIVATAEEKCCERCPYLNVRRECTAAFGCINQVFRAGRERPLCSGQHKINFGRGSNCQDPGLQGAGR
jgi:hypothetical protein